QDCYVCGKSGAAITCRGMGCQRSFHLPCATKGECITQYCRPYRAFCSQHRPVQVVEVAPDKGTRCLLCLDEMEASTSFRSLVCPACRHAWFHRSCIQGQALSDGFSRFQCPLCRDRDTFRREMRRIGIRIPSR
ncbi:G2E3 ligase, partial [Halcyon senegalensis]|nr:G2E3 ligase [Halcyon senegalensis]